MTIAVLIAGLLSFVLMLRILRAQQVAAGVLDTARGTLALISDRHITDEEKEAQIRRASLRMFGSFAIILGIAVISLAVPAAIVWLGAELEFYTLDQAMAVALGWPFILASTAVAIGLWILLERRANPQTGAGREEVPYSPLDQALHAYAFASPARQQALGRLETRLYRSKLNADHANRPVLITSLPRAGTTILLEALADHPELASATYRQMPFTMSPLLWGRFSGLFRKTGEKAERAHGDGISVGVDSPEAFEEIMWMSFWPDHYDGASIRLWSQDARNEEFERFFHAHLTKIVAAKGGAAHRYLSKNNANIARLSFLQTLQPDANVVIPLRNPWAQIASLHRQHLRFVDLHRREPFARTYMEGIGHLEFGAALQPIAFDGAPEDIANADKPEFWLRYWISAYRSILSTLPDNALLVDHDALCANPQAHLGALADAIGLNDVGALTEQATRFRATRPADPPADLPEGLIRQANDIHHELRRLALTAD